MNSADAPQRDLRPALVFLSGELTAVPIELERDEVILGRSLLSELRREASRARSEGRPFCVLMMDLDHFKGVNDTYGHLTGSHTLEELASCIVNNLRSGDAASRFGGEEFAAFLLDADIRQ